METSDLIKPTTAELPDGWGKQIHGRLVTFGEGEDLAWGVEATIPVTRALRSTLIEHGFKVENLETITILDLSPQESLAPDARTIKSKSVGYTELQRILDVTTDHHEPWEKTTKNGSRANDQITKILIRVMGNNSGAKDYFNKSQNETQSLVIVIGHGGGDPRSVGEQRNTAPKDSHGRQLQRVGNNVLVEEVMQFYDGDPTIGAILLDSCYFGKEPIHALSKPVFYLDGAATLSDLNPNKFKYTEPENVLPGV